jgi:hypothetical protein
MSQMSGTVKASSERTNAPQRSAGSGFTVEDVVPIALWVDVPRVGVNNCLNPLTASGGVTPSNCNVTAYLSTPGGNIPGAVVVGPGNAWRCTFANDPPSNVSLALVVTASDANGQSKQKVIPFSCGPVTGEG